MLFRWNARGCAREGCDPVPGTILGFTLRDFLHGYGIGKLFTQSVPVYTAPRSSLVMTSRISWLVMVPTKACVSRSFTGMAEMEFSAMR